MDVSQEPTGTINIESVKESLSVMFNTLKPNGEMLQEFYNVKNFISNIEKAQGGADLPENQQTVSIPVHAKDRISGRMFDGIVEVPGTVLECLEKWGEEVTFGQIVQRIKARMGHKIRTWLSNDKSNKYILDQCANHIPARPPKELSEVDKALQEISAEKDPDKQKTLIAELTEKLEKKQDVEETEEDEEAQQPPLV